MHSAEATSVMVDAANLEELPVSSHNDSGSVRCGSTTSTRSDETPFPQLIPKVERLCLSIWSKLVQRTEPLLPPDQGTPRTLVQRFRERSESLLPRRLRSRSAISPAAYPYRKAKIERLTNGTFNRIVAITIPEAGGVDIQVILRIPRDSWHKSDPERDVAILRYVRQHTSIPVADIITFDYSDDNPLKSAYVVQSRIPGTDLLRNGDLTLDQATQVARQLGEIMLSMQDVTKPWPGRVKVCKNAVGDEDFEIRPFDVEFSLSESDVGRFRDVGASWTETKLQNFYSDHFNFLASQFARWRAQELHDAPYTIQDPDDIYKALVDLVSEMDESLCLGRRFRDSKNSLCHLDFRSRNIMVQTQVDGEIKITGVLDWDSAIFAPFWVGCAPPHWMWADEDDETFDENDETNAGRIPSTEHGRKVKQAWEEAVGEDFCRFSYDPEYRIARRLFHFALYGIHSTWETREAEALIEEWKPIRAEYLEFKAAAEEELANGEASTGLNEEVETKKETHKEEAAMEDVD